MQSGDDKRDHLIAIAQYGLSSAFNEAAGVRHIGRRQGRSTQSEILSFSYDDLLPVATRIAVCFYYVSS